MKRIAIVAGELSGDQLGADLLRALKRRYPEARFEGIGGPAMCREGLLSLYPIETLSVMGLMEVLAHLPRLVRVRRELVRHFRANPPDLFVGIDSPDFNLGLERALRRAGTPTAHYVSPSVWAWRSGRIRGIARSVDHMLTLLPFEADFYEAHGVPVTFVGHPAADRFPLDVDVGAYRRRLALPEDARILSVLPGSRRGEVERLSGVFMAAAAQVARREPGLIVVVPVAEPGLRAPIEAACTAAGLSPRLLEASSDVAMGAADVVLTASGTATLEAMLLKRPMVVAYRVSAATAWLVRRLRLVRIRQFALPNLLVGRPVVAEHIQEQVTAEALARSVEALLNAPDRVAELNQLFRVQHERLRRGAGDRAAEVLADLMERP